MKPLYKKVRVIHDPSDSRYTVQYKNWFTWQYESSIKYGQTYMGLSWTQYQAEAQCINRAKSILQERIVFEKSNWGIK